MAGYVCGACIFRRSACVSYAIMTAASSRGEQGLGRHGEQSPDLARVGGIALAPGFFFLSFFLS
jgi:hypothetical protein